jgi:hypothetical protein
MWQVIFGVIGTIMEFIGLVNAREVSDKDDQ